MKRRSNHSHVVGLLAFITVGLGPLAQRGREKVVRS